MPKPYDSTSLGGPNRRFPVTDWTRIQDPTQRESILSELYKKYWKPLYHYLRCKRFSNDKAKDLVQGFFTEQVLGRQFIQKADKTRGKFRTFLLSAIANYAIDVQRQEKPSQELDEDTPEPAGTSDPESKFNRAWADELLQEVLEELQTECNKHEKQVHWNVFRAWLLEPNLDNGKIRMDEICAEYGIASRDKAYNMIANIKGRFRAILRRRLRPLVESDAEIDIEIREFINIFSRNLAR